MDIPKEFLSKEFLSQFKTGEDVTAFMKELHTRVYEQMLEAEMDNHLGYEKHSNQGDHSGDSRNGSYKKQIQTEMGESVIQVPRDRKSEFEPVVVPKHQSPVLRYHQCKPFPCRAYCKGTQSLRTC